MIGLSASAGWISSRTLCSAQTAHPLPDLRLGFYTDVHARPDRDAPAALDLAASVMGKESVDLWICGGDLIHGGHQTSPSKCAPLFEFYRTFLERLARPVHHVVGNHDLAGAFPADGSPSAQDPRALWREWTGHARTYRAFDAGDYRVILLDSIELTGGEKLYRGHIDQAQIEWLRQEIDSLPKDQPIILGTHIPFRTTFAQATQNPNAGHPPNLVVENANDVLDLFRDRHLPLVLQGHLHSNEWIDWAGRKFLMGGALSAAWWRGPNRRTGFGYGLVEVSGNRINWDYRGYGWPV